MARTLAQKRELGIKKKGKEGRKPTVGLNSVTVNKSTKRKPTKSRRLRTQQVDMEEEDNIKPSLKATPKPSRLANGQHVSQEQIDQLIGYIVNDKMSIMKAARKAKLSPATAFDYYNLYKSDLEKKTPSPETQDVYTKIVYTHQDIKKLIGYINDDRMTIKGASAKVKMSYDTGRKYYRRYLKDPERNIPIPILQQNYTQDQKKEFIGYIVNDKMNIKEASLKAKMTLSAGRKYYHKYFDDQNTGIATPSHITQRKPLTKEQKKEFISYIVDDKMTLATASMKSNICIDTGRKHYRQYLKDNNMEIPESRKTKRYTQDNTKELIGYIVDDKMSITAASEKANIHYQTAYKYYRKYLKDQERSARVRRR